MAEIINHDSTWTRAYVAYREFGAASFFGETTLWGMTMTQSELLALSQLYDVIHSQHDVMDAMPEDLLKYPTKMSKWYSDFSDKRRKEMGKGKKGESQYGWKKDTEGDGLGFKRFAELGDPLSQKSTDWAVKYMKAKNNPPR